jgi:integrase
MRGQSTAFRTPSLRRHKPSGRAVVTLDGKDHYLGPWPEGRKKPAPEVQAAYDQLIAEWLANGRRLQPPPDEAEAGLAVNELILAFWHYAEQHYRREDGTHTNELNDWRLSLKPLKELYGLLAVTEFSPLKLKAVRQKMMDARRYRVQFTEEDNQTRQRWVWEHCFRRTAGGCEALWKKKWCPAELLAEKKALARGVINQRIGRIVRMFKWGVSEEIVPESVWRALTTVRGLEKGRSPARETEPVKPVREADVFAVLPYALPPVRAMAELQLLTGMRPGEACAMRACDIEMSGAIWMYRPPHHKTRHKGKQRVVAIGPRAQEIIKPFLKLDMQAYLFSPRDAMEWRRREARLKRKTKVQPSQVCRKRKKPKLQPGERYRNHSYALAIVRAIQAANTARACDQCKELKPEERCADCKAAAVPHWHPHQVRHTHATEVRRRFGLEAAQVALGHSQAQITEVYAERDLALAAKVAQQIG